MSLIGKILLVLQVALSLCFMAFAAAVHMTQTNWRTKATKSMAEVKSAKDELQIKLVDFERQKNEMTVEMNRQKDAAATALADATQLRTELASEKRLHEDAKKERDDQKALNVITSRESEARIQEAMKRREFNDADKKALADLKRQTEKLEAEIYTRDKTIANQEDKHAKVLEENARFGKLLDAHGIARDAVVAASKLAPPPAGVEGLVIATKPGTRNGSEFIEISLGSDDGIAKGHNLFVVRKKDAKYLGKIEIVFVTSDRAVGTLVERAKNGQIQKDDNVTSQL